MPPRITVIGEALRIRKLYEAGALPRASAIDALVSLGFAPATAAAATNDEQLKLSQGFERLMDINITSQENQTPQYTAPHGQPAFPTNLVNEQSPNLGAHVDSIFQNLQARLIRHASTRNLILFDGSVFDQLVLRIVESTLNPSTYKVICSVRPCMDARLQEEVHRFAKSREYELIDYVGDCKVDFKTLQVVGPRCTSITPRIKAFFEDGGGSLITGSASTDEHLIEMSSLNTMYSNSHLIHDLNTGDVLWRHDFPQGYDCRTLLLLHGLMPYEIVACNIAFNGSESQLWHVPECYLPCYFEVEKRRVRVILEHSITELKAELDSSPAQHCHGRSSIFTTRRESGGLDDN